MPALHRFLPLLTLLSLAGSLPATEPAQPAAAGKPAEKPATVTPHAQPVPLTYGELVLADGRKLQKVTVKSYDPKTDKFLLFADGKALMLPGTQVPDPLGTRLKAAAPTAGASTSTPPPAVVQPVTKITPHPFDNLQGRFSDPVVTSASPAGPALAEHKNAALNRADRHYHSEYLAGSKGAYMNAVTLESGEPEAITGWPNRYRTQGKATLDWSDGRGGSHRGMPSTFEVITEAHGSSVTVLDFTVKS